MSAKPVLGLTMGDPAGIGPEICLRALREPSVLKICQPILFGDASVLRRLDSKTYKTSEPHIVDCSSIDGAKVQPGKISASCGKAGYIYIERAIQAALAGKIDGVVTAPIHKESLHLSGVKFPG